MLEGKLKPENERYISNIVGHTGSRAPQPIYTDHAISIGEGLGAAGFKKFIYGDGRSGTMGDLARAAIRSGMEVQGITLNFFLAAQGKVLPGANPSISVKTMTERKAQMRQLGDAVIPLSGGFGTLEEIFEWWGSSNGKIKPSVLSPVGSFYDGLVQFVDDAIGHKHVLPSLKNRFNIAADAGQAIEKIYELSFKPMGKDYGAPIVTNLNSKTHFKVTDTAIVIDHASLDLMEDAFATLVGYDVSNIEGQTIWEPHDYLRKIIFDNTTGVFDGLKKQVDTIFDVGFTTQDRRALIAFPDAKSELEGMVEDVKMNPILPSILKIKHAEAKPEIKSSNDNDLNGNSPTIK